MPETHPAEIVLPKSVKAPEKRRSALSLGDEPEPPRGESCNIRNVLTASETLQRETFDGLIVPAEAAGRNKDVQDAARTLARLQEAFGDDEHRPQ